MQDKIYALFESYFLHPSFRGVNADRRESICAATLMVCAITSVFMAAQYLKAGQTLTTVFISLGIMGIFVAMAVHRFLANRIWAVNMAMTSLFFVIMVPSLIYKSGGDAPGILWIGNCIMFVNFLLSLEWTIFWGLAFVAGIVGLNMQEHMPFATYGDMSVQDYNEMLFYTSVISTITMIWFSYQYKRSRDVEKKVLVDYDIKLQATLAELSSAKEELQKRLEQNANLVRVISHDIATPLQVIKLSQMRIPEELAVRKRIEKATDALTSILDYVREYRAVLDGKKEVKMLPVSMTGVVHCNLALFEEKLEEKGLKLIMDLPQNDLKVLGDINVLGGIVLANLVSNAIKFTASGGTIEVQLREQNRHIVLSIRDSGIGIPRSILENIFAIDKKTSRIGTNGEVGTGFGMPLVKTYVEMHRGTISIHSWEHKEFPANHGTLIEISIPTLSHQTQAA